MLEQEFCGELKLPWIYIGHGCRNRAKAAFGCCGIPGQYPNFGDGIGSAMFWAWVPGRDSAGRVLKIGSI